MTRSLIISDDLSLPIDAATQTFAFIARKGAGKTYAAGKLAECLIDAGVQVVVLDSVGNWWGLRLTADGKEAAYDIPVIGGLRGDIPLEATGGKLIADTIVETGRSLIIDVSQFSKGDRQRFATDLGERLWLKKKAEHHPSPVHLIIEESQLIVPERVSGRDSGARMVGIYEEIIRLGRNFGIGVSMISQRPQSVNKEVLNQAECLVALQVNGKHERTALRDWITFHGAEKNLVDELPGLPIGTAYIWSPQWLRILKKVRIGTKKTFDASATPKVGSHQVRRDLKPLQLDDLQERMSATIEKAKQEDPKELRKQIAELKKAKGVPDAASIDRAVAKAVEDAQKEWKRIEQENQRAISDLRGRLDKIAQLAQLNGNAPAIAEYKPIAPRIVSNRHAPGLAAGPTNRTNSSSDLKTPERRILTVLAQRPEGVNDLQRLATLAGYTVNGHFNNVLGNLRTKEYVSPARVMPIQITNEGVSALGEFDPSPTGKALQRWWLQRLATPEKRILEALIANYPDPIELSELAKAAGYTVNGHFNNVIGGLRTKGLMTPAYAPIKASDDLFD
jgi:uncharacterized protein